MLNLGTGHGGHAPENEPAAVALRAKAAWAASRGKSNRLAAGIALVAAGAVALASILWLLGWAPPWLLEALLGGVLLIVLGIPVAKQVLDTCPVCAAKAPLQATSHSDTRRTCRSCGTDLLPEPLQPDPVDPEWLKREYGPRAARGRRVALWGYALGMAQSLGFMALGVGGAVRVALTLLAGAMATFVTAVLLSNHLDRCPACNRKDPRPAAADAPKCRGCGRFLA